MKTMKASEFKATCLRVMDEVAKSGEPVVITKNGVPTAQLAPIRKRPKKLFGALKGMVTITGDIISPVEAEWEVLK